ncbi:MAG: T9SS type A sorting domain-containing protein [Bacteroidota bacterium]|nr:T9SS type A sorting domain-containing protein [Bacteroidota bacterium]
MADGMPTDFNPATPNANTTARVIDVTTRGSEYILWEKTPPVGDTLFANTNAEKNYVTDVDFKLEYMSPQENPSAPGLHITLFVLMSNNGIAAFRSKAVFPVELSTLRAALSAASVDLRWDVTMETNNHGFDIERSFDRGENWQRIGFVAGRGTTTRPMTYRYADPLTSTHENVGKVQYRLRQVDNDGAYAYSPVVTVRCTSTALSITLAQNYPNPFNPSTTIEYGIPAEGNVRLRVFDLLAREVAVLVDEMKQAGTHTEVFNASEHPSGIYVYQLECNGTVMTRRMTLMK